jgi:two-component system cell cycle sensor histidine kinase/response regulator CckA
VANLKRTKRVGQKPDAAVLPGLAKCPTGIRGLDEVYRLMVEKTAEGALILTADGLIVFANPQIAALMGLPLERVAGSRIHEFVALEDHAGLEALLSARESAKAELRLRRSDGTTAPVYMAASRVPCGKVEYVTFIVTDLSEQKKQQEIILGANLLRSVLEHAPAAILVLDRDGRIVQASRAAKELARKPVLDRNFESVFSLRSCQDGLDLRFEDIVSAIRREGKIAGLEAVAAVPGGEAVNVIVHAGFLGTDAEAGCLVTLFDVSALKRTEDALRASEERFRTLADNMAQLAWMADATGSIFWFNRRWYDFTGTTLEEVQGWGWQKIHHPEHVNRVVAWFKRSMETGEPCEDTFPLRRKDGTYRWFLGRARPIRNADGQVVRWFGTTTDITELREAEQSARESEQRYQALFESMQEGFAVGEIICDDAGNPVDWRYLQVNEALASIIGRPRDEIVGRTYREIFPDVPWRPAVETVGRVALTRRPARVEPYGLGTRRSLDVIVYSPAPGQFAAVLTDITARRQAEERLRQSQKIESLGLLAGGVAHDFNNLLTVIMGSASVALEEYPSSKELNAIMSAAESAARLTRQLLAYAGKGYIAHRAIDLTQFVERTRSLIEASVPKRVELAFQLASQLPAIEEDAGRVEQILINLVINAAEAIPPKTDGRIEIATGTCEVTPEMARKVPRYDVAPGPYVWLEVRDTGDGMNEATVERIFDPFFSTKFLGRGLGLAAVGGIVRTAKGFIEVRSKPGAGATFRVYLPASDKKPRTEAAPAAPHETPRGACSILVVDDEEMVRKLACTILEQHGYRVLEAADGKEALRLLAEAPSPPCLVLLDIAMPVMGGGELVPVLASKYPTVKIVVSSGYAEEEVRTTAPVDGYLQKPYTVIGLREKIDEILTRPRPNRPIVENPGSEPA